MRLNAYPPVNACRELHITRLHSLYYFQFSPEDKLEGESHDFWELVYVDEAQTVVQSGSQRFLVRQGEVFVHSPNRYHCIHLLPDVHPSVFIVSFSLHSDALRRIQDRPLETGRTQRVLMSRLLEEGRALYGPLLDCHRNLARDQRQSARFGALQMIVDYLELLLIELMRSAPRAAAQPAAPVTWDERPEILVKRLKNHMRQHLSDRLTFEDCCRYLNMSATTLKALFRGYAQEGVMHCYQRMRVGEACRMLRSGKWNVTEVAAELGYSSCQAFSTQFRRLMGTSPTAYLRRVAVGPEFATEDLTPQTWALRSADRIDNNLARPRTHDAGGFDILHSETVRPTNKE